MALGRAKADSVIRDGRLVNVDTGELLDGVDVAIKGERIALVGDAGHCVGKGMEVIDAGDEFLVPGLLDAHVHVESSMLTPTQFTEAVLPRGTTGVFADPHEIANVLGMRGIELMLDESEDLPIKFFFTVPSCVPSAPRFETTGAELGPREITKVLRWSRVVGLAELMNFPGVLAGDEKMLGEIEASLQKRAIVEGHAPGLRGKQLAAYVAAGARSDHESIALEEAIEKLRLGMRLEFRESSVASNLKLIKPILELKLDTKHCMLATDDRNPRDLLEDGHMDHAVRRAIEEGVDPVNAIRMATINVAEHFRLDEDIGSISPGKLADVLVVENLERFEVGKVIANGKLVAAHGKLLIKFPKPSYPAFAKATMHLRPASPQDFAVKAPIEEGEIKVRVIGLIEGELVTEHRIISLPVAKGIVEPDLTKDVVRVAVLERHHRTGGMSRGFVQGFGIREGAIASSMGHDAHNLIVVGCDERDMAAAANSIVRMGGGQSVVREAKLSAKLKLPIAGLMSDEPARVVSAKLGELENAARELGISLDRPFTVLSFLQLAVMPELRITDKGLIDVEKSELVDLFM